MELIAAEDFDDALAQDETPEIVVSGTGFVYAPIAQGQEAGYAYVLLGDKTVGKIPLQYGETVEQTLTPKKTLWEKLFGG